MPLTWLEPRADQNGYKGSHSAKKMDKYKPRARRPRKPIRQYSAYNLAPKRERRMRWVISYMNATQLLSVGT